MLESQKIELRRSKIRERLGEIVKLEGDGYSGGGEGRKSAPYRTSSLQFRAADAQRQVERGHGSRAGCG